MNRRLLLFLPLILFGGWNAFSQSTVTELEYFINTDPGVGNANTIAVTAGQEIDITDILGTSALSPGFYTIYIRAKDQDNNWGFYESRTFVVRTSGGFQEPIPTNVVKMELFFDTDPGQGNGIDLQSFSSDLVVDISELIPNSLTAGWHTVGVRAQNANGDWGLTEYRRIYIDDAVGTPDPIAKIVELEYFYGDTDPGVGNGTSIAITPAADSIDLIDFDIPTPGDLPIGINKVTIRAKNEQGLWSFTSTREFEISDDCVQPTAGFNVEIACANEEVRFLDVSTDVSSSASYRWYLDGDDEVDSNVAGDVSFTYQNPGNYTVALVIDQGETCVDSTFFDIEIKAKPIVVFNADKVDVGEPTQFEVFQFFTDNSFNWFWDFETDGNVDDNTSGSTSHTYPAIGQYQATVVLNDNSGCGTSFTRQVSVEAAGSGGSGLEALFTANTVCDGNAMLFTDLSRDIPSGATYSWDFDGDGSTDDTTAGDVSHMFPASGTYTTTLKITLQDGGVFMHTEIVQVRPQPISSFTATTVCLGQATTFSNTSTGTDESTIYSWDLDGDNNPDSNSADGVSFTYSAAGQYSVLLTVDNGSGCFSQSIQTISVIPVPIPDFTADAACVGEEVTFLDNSTDVWPLGTYQWDFDGDGNVDSENKGNAFFTFTSSGEYNASLTIDNGFGCTTTITKMISFQSAAQPDFSANRVCLGEETIFTDLSSQVDSDAIYNWDFDGDGNIDSQLTGDNMFVFTQPGSYNASLLINTGDCPARIEKVIFVDALPIPDLDTNISLCEGESVTLDPGEFSTYFWSDESTSRTLTVETAGEYSLTVSNENNCENTTSFSVVVQEDVTAFFGKTSEPKDFSNLVTFENLSEGADSYLWDFGDGNTSTDENPAHEYTDINLFFGSAFEVCLTAFNDCSSEQYCEFLNLIVTEVEPEIDDRIVIFPNPTRDFVTVKWPEGSSTITIRISDINGKLVFNKTLEKSPITNYQINTSTFQSGQYLVEVITDKRILQDKLMIK